MEIRQIHARHVFLCGLLAILLWVEMLTPAWGQEVGEGSSGGVLYADNFEHGLGQWKIEAQDPATSVSATGGGLDVYAPEGVTIWFRHPLDGNYEIRFRATPLASSFNEYPKRISDLNVFWNATLPDAIDGNPTQGTLGGTLAAYNRLHLYYVGLGANGNKTTRLRKYDGTAARPQIAGYAVPTEATDADRQGVPPPFALLADGVPVTIRIVSRLPDAAGVGLLQFFANDHLVFEFRDSQPYVAGWFAFRTTKSHFRLQDFSVIRR